MDSANLNFGMYQLITQERERHGVRFVCDYEIWQDQDTVMAGYEGYAHFETERGYSLIADDGDSFQIISSQARNHYSTKEKREELFECGYEFISIMKIAALSIGTAAVYGKPGFTNLSELFPSPETDLFWQHTVQSWVALGIATDRLRTYFVRFVRRESERRLSNKLNKEKDNKPDQYVYTQAFIEYSAEELTNAPRQRMDKLKSLVADIANCRSKRNKFVHDYASREAMISVARRANDKDHADVFKALQNEKTAYDYTKELADAYNVLSRAGNLVFSLEKDITELYGETNSRE